VLFDNCRRRHSAKWLLPCEERAGCGPTNGLAPSLGPSAQGVGYIGAVDQGGEWRTWEERAVCHAPAWATEARALPAGDHQALLCDVVLEHAIKYPAQRDSAFLMLKVHVAIIKQAYGH